MNRRRGEGSSLKKYQENPEFLVSSAIQSFRSKKKKQFLLKVLMISHFFSNGSVIVSDLMVSAESQL